MNNKKVIVLKMLPSSNYPFNPDRQKRILLTERLKLVSLKKYLESI